MKIDRTIAAGLVIGASIIIATGIVVYFDEFHTCMRAADPNGEYSYSAVVSVCKR